MAFWKIPPKIKVYEALGSLANKRIEIEGNTAKVYSSSGNKFYTVTYDPATSAIMCNDNGSYWQGYLGYPAICFLLAKGVISYSPEIAELLKDIKWKDINTQFKNDWDKTEKYVKDVVSARGGNVRDLESEIDRVYQEIQGRKFTLFGPKKRPPSGY